VGGTRWRIWLRHCATGWKVAVSIPDGIIEIFHWLNPSSQTVVLGSTQLLTAMSIRNISWGQRLITLPRSCVDCLDILGSSTFWSPSGLSRSIEGHKNHNNSMLIGPLWPGNNICACKDWYFINFTILIRKVYLCQFTVFKEYCTS